MTSPPDAPLAAADDGNDGDDELAYVFPASLAQQRLWFLEQLVPGTPTYNIADAWRLDGALDVAVLERAFGAVVARHETLRTAFAAPNGVPVQVVAPELDVRLPPIDLPEAELAAFVSAEAHVPFDLEARPLFRAKLVRLAPERHVLVFVVHHIVFDGWSSGVFAQELAALYDAFVEGRPSPLPDLLIQYADYAQWQRDAFSDGGLEAHLTWWRAALDGVPTSIDLPVDHPRPRVQSFRGGHARFTASASGLAALCRREGVSAFMVVLAAYAHAIARLAGQRRLIVGSPVANRTRTETEGLIGFFANMLPLPVDLSGDPTVAELLARVRATTLGAFDRQDIPFDSIVEAVQPERRLDRSVLFQAALSLTSRGAGADSPDEASAGSRLRVAPLDVATDTAKFDLLLTVDERGESFAGSWEYNVELFEPSTIERFTACFTTALAAMVAHPERRLSAISVLPESELRRVVHEWNATATPYRRDARIVDLFEEQVARAPDAVAVIGPTRTLTYRELDAIANRVAHALRARGVGPEVFVALSLHRSEAMVIAVLAVLKAGGAYVPLDSRFPRARLDQLVAATRAKVTLTESALAAQVSGVTEHVLALDEPDWYARESAAAPRATTGAESTAYVIFTSGSTGVPKGVLVRHRPVVNLIEWVTKTFGVGPSDRVLFVTSLGFDLSVYDVFGLLAAGGSIRVATSEEVRDPDRLVSILLKEPVTFWDSAPAALQQLAPLFPRGARPETSLRLVFLSGDWIPVRLPDAVRAVFTQAQVVALGGATEATVWSNFFPVGVVPPSWPSIPYGRPIQNARYHVLDGDLAPCPVGVAGDLYIGGEVLSTCYVGDPALTASKFVPDPFGASGDRLYRTGDRARWFADGNLEFLGRLDHQVKVRGFRIELGEIESVLREHGGVRDVVTLARADRPGDARLVAYVVPLDLDAPPSIDELRERARLRLPEYMVPAAFVTLARLPVTANGKLDRAALPAPEAAAAAQGGAAVASTRDAWTPHERAIAAIWEAVLGEAPPSEAADFFENGGHSLSATRVVARIREELGVELAVRAVFESPRLCDLAAVVERAASAERATATEGAGQGEAPIPLLSRAEPLPLSFAQERLWFLERLTPGRSTYHIPIAVRVVGELDRVVLDRALGWLQRRHESLRTTFTEIDGQPRAVVHPADAAPEVRARYVDAAAVAPTTQALAELLERISVEPFDLERGPLWRVALVRTSASEHVAALTVHHLVSDAWSLSALVRELGVAYDAFAAGEAPSAAPHVVEYADWAAAQRALVEGPRGREALAAMRDALDGAPPTLDLPLDFARPAVTTGRGAHFPFEVPADVTAAIESLARAVGVTRYMLLLAAFQVLLARRSGQRDVVVGSPVANRTRADVEDVVGLFVNMVVVRATVVGTFRELLARVRDATLDAFSRQFVPFEWVVGELGAPRDLARSPLFQVSFSLQNVAVPALTLRGVRIEPFDAATTGTAKFELGLEMVGGGDDALGGTFEYATDLFARETVEQMTRELLRLLEHATRDPDLPVSALAWLDPAEERRVVAEWNATRRAYRGGLVHDLVDARARQAPSRVALADDGGVVTFDELRRWSDKLARRLAAAGVRTDERVCLLHGRSRGAAVGMLGVLKSGGCYVPLETSYPDDRLRRIVSDASARVVVAERAMAERARALGAARVELLEDARDDDDVSDAEKGRWWAAHPESLAYVVYTSGSTGRAKGVENRHSGLTNLVRWFAENHGLSAADEVVEQASLGFDASALELWPALAAGACVHVMPDEVKLDRPALVAWLAREAITVVQLPPLVAETLLEGDLDPRLRVRSLLTGSDKVTRSPRSKKPFAFETTYGPTEASVIATWTVVAPRADGGAPSIGRPLGNVRVYVLDGEQRPVPIGVAGEIYIGGVGVGRGYAGAPAQTAERFVPDPFAPPEEPGARLYRTGDLARWGRDGDVWFIGRADGQIKLRGYRIELGEIERVLLEQPGVREAVVVVRAAAGGEKQLVGYVVGELDVAELRASLARVLPVFMVPSAIVRLARMPVTRNGKLDRRALPAPVEEDVRAAVGSEYVEPRTDAERTLAEVWKEVLGLARVGVRDNFFELGGDSIKSLQIVARARARGLTVSVRDTFERQTIDELAHGAEAETADDAGARAAADVEREGEEAPGPVAMTPAQSFWFEGAPKERDLFAQAIVLRTKERVRAGALRRWAARAVAAHGALRTRFVDLGGGVSAEVVGATEAPDAAVEEIDASGSTTADAERALAELGERLSRTLSLDAARLFALGSVAMPDGSGRVIAVVHHVAIDGVSWRSLFAAGLEEDTAPARGASVRAWTDALARWSTSDAGARAGRAWSRLVARWHPSARVPGGERSRRLRRDVRIATARLDRAATASLWRGLSSYRLQPLDLLVAALAPTLLDWLGGDHVRVTMEGHGRDPEAFDAPWLDVGGTVGWFTSLYPIELTHRRGFGARDVVVAAKESLRAAPDRGATFLALRQLGDDETRGALRAIAGEWPEISFNYFGQVDESGEKLGGESAGSTMGEQQQREHLLDVSVAVTAGELEVTFAYDAATQDGAAMEALARRYVGEVVRLADHCASDDAGALTPSDVALAGLDAAALRALASSRGLDERTFARSVADVWRLTGLQEGLLFHAASEPRDVYLLQLALRLGPGEDMEAFEAAWTETVARHEALRTSFEWEVTPHPVQIVHRGAVIEIEREDWRGGARDRAVLVADVLARQRRRGFDLRRAPLARVVMAREDEGWTTIVTMHHIVTDGWSLPLLFEDLLETYAARRARPGASSSRPASRPPPPSYRAYLAWWLAQDESSAERWFRAMFRGFEAPTVLYGRGGRREEAGERGTASLALDAEIQARVDALLRRARVTASTLLHAAWAIVLAAHTATRDVVFGSTTSGRSAPVDGVEKLVGLLINTLAVRVRLGDDAVDAWLQRLQTEQLELRQFEHTPLQRMRGWTDVAAGLELFNTLVVFENYPAEGLAERVGGLDLRGVELEQGTHYTLSLIGALLDGRMSLQLEFDRGSFDRGEVERLLAHVARAFDALASAAPDARVASLTLVSPAERALVLEGWNATSVAWPDEAPTVAAGIERQVDRTPAREAVRFEGDAWTYAELDAWANGLARRLRDGGVGPETRVGVCLERSLELVGALVGALKAGGAYVPLDPGYPSERLTWQIDDARAAVVITSRAIAERLDLGSAPRVYVDDVVPSAERVSGASLADRATLAYVIYTSGTTGRPKGAMNAHEGVMNRLAWMQRAFGLGEGDAVVQKTPFSFDVSVWELFWPLLTGARLVVARPEGHKDPAYLADLIASAGVTTAHFVPSMLAAFLEEPRAAAAAAGALRRVVASGEALGADVVRRFAERFPGVELHNLYGPTEAAVDVSAWRADPAEDVVPIGRPIANTRLYVLDAFAQPVPVGVAGELHIGGVQVGRGYLDRPGLTAERFVPDPFGAPGARLYRTGDVARFRDDGAIEYLGRRDDQVKVRGFRVELGEIEHALSQATGVRGAAVVAREGRLVAYVVGDAAFDSLRERLARSLPEHMVPTSWVRVERLPLSPNGKLDRRALPAPEAAAEATAAYVAPRDAIEQALAELFAEVLGAARVGVHTSFFELGGHSLLAMRLVTRARSALATELSVRAVFEHPTVAGLAALVAGAAAAPTAHEPLTRAPRGGDYALSHGQERIWFVDRLLPGAPTYNVPVRVRVRGDLDVERIARAVSDVVDRHESLRMRFFDRGGEPRAVVDAPSASPPALPIVDVADGDPLDLAADDEANRPFDLERGPLARVTVFRVSPREHVVMIVVHHIVTDGWSMGLMISEIVERYAASAQHGTPPTPPALDYLDYVAWQRRRVSDDRLADSLAWWKRTLEGAPAHLDVPTDHPHPRVPSGRGGLARFTIGGDVTAQIEALARREGATPFMVLLAGLEVVLARRSGQRDVVVGTAVSNRTTVESESMLGLFINVLPLRAEVRGTFREQLARVKEAVLASYAHQEVPFERIVDAIQPPRTGRSPVFQVLLALQNAPTPALDVPGLSWAMEPVKTRGLHYELLFELGGGGGVPFTGRVEYALDLFEPRTIEVLTSELRTALDAATRDPSQPVDDLPLMTWAEERKVVHEWNATATAFDREATIVDLVERQVARSPDAVAVVGPACSLTYAELNARANRVAHALRGRGVGPEVFVAICLERSELMVVAVLAVLKAGGAYLPLDPRAPRARLEGLVATTRARVVLAETALDSVAAGLAPEVLALDDESWQTDQPARDPRHVTGAESTAYVIFTSGSTGVPKGVLVRHRPVVNLIEWATKTFGVGPSDRVLFVTSLGFDLSVYDVFGLLAVGGSIRVATSAELRDPHRLVAALLEEPITFWDSAPAALQQLVPLFPREARPTAALRLVFQSGDWIPVPLPDAVRAVFPRAEIIALGGATEATVWSNCYRVGVVPPSWPSIPYGRPIQNARYHVLDRAMRPCPVGVPGDLYIGGEVLATCYVADPSLTASKFVPDPFGAPGDRLYRTGDRARWFADGNLEFLGRLDHQVKIRGYRIELGEIESVLREVPGVGDVVAVARVDRPEARGEARLVAYVVPADAAAPPSVDDLRERARAKLPDYMIPSAFVTLAHLPVTANGKLDRAALPAPEGPARAASWVAPRTAAEEAIASLFAEVLGVADVGVGAYDDFFELGGHSLAAVRLAAAAERLFGTRVPVSALFEDPTVAGLAARVATGVEAEGDEALVALDRRGEGRAPLFLVHGAGGEVLTYRALAAELGGDRPVWGLAAVRGDAGKRTLRETAARYVASVRRATAAAAATATAAPPIHLAGYSSGATLAFEMAAQLRAAGAPVGAVLLVDGAAPDEDRRARVAALARSIAHFRERLEATLARGGRVTFDDVAALSDDPEVKDLVAWVRARSGAEPTDAFEASYEEHLKVYEASLRTEAAHEPASTDVDVVVVRAAGSMADAGSRSLGWERYTTGRVEVVVVPGNHESILEPPHVHAVARELRKLLDWRDDPSRT